MIFWVLWISDVPVTGVFFVVFNKVGVVGPVGVISGIVCESIPVVFYKFYWFRSCFVVEVVSGSIGRGDPKDFVFYVCWEVVRSSSVDPSSLVWVVVEVCTNVCCLDNKLGLMSRPDLTCHLTNELSIGFEFVCLRRGSLR